MKIDPVVLNQTWIHSFLHGPSVAGHDDQGACSPIAWRLGRRLPMRNEALDRGRPWERMMRVGGEVGTGAGSGEALG